MTLNQQLFFLYFSQFFLRIQTHKLIAQFLIVLQQILDRQAMKLALVMLLVVLASANIWDNIFSQMNSQSPIILKESAFFKFPLNYEGISLEGNFDFNKDLNVITVSVQKNIFIATVRVFVLQIDLSTFIVEIDQILQGCSKYTIEGINQYAPQGFDLDKYEDKIYLINLLFQWVGKTTISGLRCDEYQLKPDLFLGHTPDHEIYEQNPLVLVDSQGQINKLYVDKNRKKQIPFHNKSLVSKKLACQKQVQIIKKEDLFDIISGLLEEQGLDIEDYQNYDFQDIFRN